jgi:hypothetical protein
MKNLLNEKRLITLEVDKSSKKKCILAKCVMGRFVDLGAAVHQAMRRCQIKRDNMGRTFSTHSDILLKILRKLAHMGV